MKKFVFSILLLLVFAGCQSDPKNPPDYEAANDNGKTLDDVLINLPDSAFRERGLNEKSNREAFLQFVKLDEAKREELGDSIREAIRASFGYYIPENGYMKYYTPEYDGEVSNEIRYWNLSGGNKLIAMRRVYCGTLGCEGTIDFYKYDGKTMTYIPSNEVLPEDCFRLPFKSENDYKNKMSDLVWVYKLPKKGNDIELKIFYNTDEEVEEAKSFLSGNTIDLRWNDGKFTTSTLSWNRDYEFWE